MRLVEQNVNHPRSLIALTRFAKHWQELTPVQQKQLFKTDQAVAEIGSKLEQWNCVNPVWTRDKSIQRLASFSALEYTLEYVKCRVLTGTNEATAFEKELVEALAKSEPQSLRITTVV